MINPIKSTITVPFDNVTIKVFETNGRYMGHSGGSYCIWDYAYNVYFESFLVHSVTVRGIRPEVAKEMFAGIEIVQDPERNKPW